MGLLNLCNCPEKFTKQCLYVKTNKVQVLSKDREGNGNPLQYSCLENPRDGGAWWAAVYGVAQSWTRLKWLSSSSSQQNMETGVVRRRLRKRPRQAQGLSETMMNSWCWLKIKVLDCETIEEAEWLMSPDPKLYMLRWLGPRLCWPGKAEGALLLMRHTSRSSHCPRQTEICTALPWSSLEKPVSESNSKSSRTQPILQPDITRHTCVRPLRTGGSTRSHIKSLYQVQETGWCSAQNQKVRTRREARDQWIPPSSPPLTSLKEVVVLQYWPRRVLLFTCVDKPKNLVILRNFFKWIVFNLSKWRKLKNYMLLLENQVKRQKNLENNVH